MVVDGLTLTSDRRQSQSLESTARLTRVAWSTRRGLMPRSIYQASCLRKIGFFARTALDERKNTPGQRSAEPRAYRCRWAAEAMNCRIVGG